MQRVQSAWGLGRLIQPLLSKACWRHRLSKTQATLLKRLGQDNFATDSGYARCNTITQQHASLAHMRCNPDTGAWCCSRQRALAHLGLCMQSRAGCS